MTGGIMFNKRLKFLLEKHDLTVAELARQTGIPKSTVQSWMASSQPSVYQLDKVATFFEMTIDELVFDRKPAGIIDQLLKEVEVHNELYRISIKKVIKKGDV